MIERLQWQRMTAWFLISGLVAVGLIFGAFAVSFHVSTAWVRLSSLVATALWVLGTPLGGIWIARKDHNKDAESRVGNRVTFLKRGITFEEYEAGGTSLLHIPAIERGNVTVLTLGLKMPVVCLACAKKGDDLKAFAFSRYGLPFFLCGRCNRRRHLRTFRSTVLAFPLIVAVLCPLIQITFPGRIDWREMLAWSGGIGAVLAFVLYLVELERQLPLKIVRWEKGQCMATLKFKNPDVAELFLAMQIPSVEESERTKPIRAISLDMDSINTAHAPPHPSPSKILKADHAEAATRFSEEQ